MSTNAVARENLLQQLSAPVYLFLILVVDTVGVIYQKIPIWIRHVRFPTLFLSRELPRKIYILLYLIYNLDL